MSPTQFPAPVPSDFTEMDNARVSRHHWKIILISGMGFFTGAYGLFSPQRRP